MTIFNLPPDALFLDTETTGFGRKDEVLELFITNLEGHHVFHRRFRPTVPISEGASDVHGLYDLDLAREDRFGRHAGAIAQLIENAPAVVAWNAPFDRRLLQQTARATYTSAWPAGRWVCAMKAVGRMVFGRDRVSLNDAADRLAVERRGADHSSRGDTLLMLDVVRVMRKSPPML